jgi:hypothetical protein
MRVQKDYKGESRRDAHFVRISQVKQGLILTGVEQTFYRWRKEYGGLKMDQSRRMKELEKENSRLKRVVAELSLEKQILKDVAEGNF